MDTLVDSKLMHHLQKCIGASSDQWPTTVIILFFWKEYQYFTSFIFKTEVHGCLSIYFSLNRYIGDSRRITMLFTVLSVVLLRKRVVPLHGKLFQLVSYF